MLFLNISLLSPNLVFVLSFLPPSLNKSKHTRVLSYNALRAFLLHLGLMLTAMNLHSLMMHVRGNNIYQNSSIWGVLGFERGRRGVELKGADGWLAVNCTVKLKREKMGISPNHKISPLSYGILFHTIFPSLSLFIIIITTH